MGANSSPNVIKDPIKQQQAVLIDQTNQCSIYCNKNGQQYQKHRVNSYGVIDFISQYDYRIKSPHPHLVNAYYIQPIGNNLFCTSQNMFNVVIERMPYRLSDLVNIESQQSINILRGALQGYKQIYKTLGLILVKDNMIGINKQNQIKVWINPRFYLNNMEPQPPHYQNIHKNKRQSTMTQNIYQLINKRTKKQGLWLKFNGEWNMVQPKTFEKSLQFLYSFIILNQIPLTTLQLGRNNIQNQSKLVLNRQFGKSSDIRKLQGIKQQNLFETPSKLLNYPQKMANITTPRSTQAYLQKSTNTNSIQRCSFSGVRARIINLPEDNSAKNITNESTIITQNRTSSQIYNLNSQTPKNNSSISYQFVNSGYSLTPQSRPSKINLPTHFVSPVNNYMNRNQILPQNLQQANRNIINLQRNINNCVKGNINFQYSSTIDKIKSQSYDNRVAQNHPSQNINNNSTTKNAIDQKDKPSKPTQSIGSQIKRMLHLNNSSNLQPYSRKSLNNQQYFKNLRRQKFKHQQSKLSQSNIHVNPQAQSQNNSKIQNKQSRVPGKIKHKFNEQSVAKQKQLQKQTKSINIKKQYLNGQQIKQKAQFQQNSQEHIYKKKIESNGPTIKQSKQDKNHLQVMNKINIQDNQQKLIKNLNQASNQHIPSISPLDHPQINPNQFRTQTGTSHRLNKLVQQTMKNSRSKTQQKQTYLESRNSPNNKKMQSSRISAHTSQANASISYKDLRNMLKSIHRKTEII